MNFVIKLFGSFILVLLLSVPVYAADLGTLTNETQHNVGSLRMVTGTAVVNSGDTYTVPFGTVVSVQLTPGDVINQGALGYSISGQTITLYPASDGGTVDFMIVGF